MRNERSCAGIAANPRLILLLVIQPKGTINERTSGASNSLQPYSEAIRFAQRPARLKLAGTPLAIA
jgi:hypothetical protein